MILKFSTSPIYLLICPSSYLHYLLPERKQLPSFNWNHFNPFSIQMPKKVPWTNMANLSTPCLKYFIASKIKLISLSFYRGSFTYAHSACCVTVSSTPKGFLNTLFCIRMDFSFTTIICVTSCQVQLLQ